jgi:hypothetical protein
VRPVCDLGLSPVGRVEPLSLAGLSFVRPVCDLGLASVGRVEPLSLEGLSFVHPVCDLGLSSVGRVEPLSLAGLSFVRPVCDLGTAPCSRLARLSRSLSAYCLSLRNPGPLIRWTSGTVEFGWIELCAPSLRPWHCFLLCTWLDFRGVCVRTACLCVTRGLSSVGRVEPLSLAGLSFVRPVCDLGTASCSALGLTFEESECILPVSA